MINFSNHISQSWSEKQKNGVEPIIDTVSISSTRSRRIGCQNYRGNSYYKTISKRTTRWLNP